MICYGTPLLGNEQSGNFFKQNGGRCLEITLKNNIDLNPLERHVSIAEAELRLKAKK